MQKSHLVVTDQSHCFPLLLVAKNENKLKQTKLRINYQLHLMKGNFSVRSLSSTELTVL